VFKNLIAYRIGAGWPDESAGEPLLQIEEALAKTPFSPCGPTQERAAGWVPPRGEAHGALAESVGGQWILRFMTEAKVVPASVLRRKVEERCAAIEQQSGRKPGRKEARDLKDELLLDLLPVAFTKQGSVTVWIDVAARLLVVDAGSQGRADEVTTALVEALQGLSLTLLDTKVSAATAMAQWLTTHDAPENFSIDQECELKAADESKSVVRYARHSLDIEEVAQHIAQGKMPTRLALTWSDRVSFVLTEGLQLKKVAFLEGVFDGTSGSGKDGGFDADVAIATGELRGLLPDLLAALGGDMERAA
jgi:recombination associated protein RdgC